jgi:Protein of unknown function (DUF2878)
MRWRRIINFAGFQIAWIASVWGASTGHEILATAIVLALIGLHLLQSPFPVAEARLIMIVGALGFTIDTTLGRAALLVFHSDGRFCPLWLVILWSAFGTTLRNSLAWLRDRPVSAVTMGAVFGPLSYYGGERFGALSLGAHRLVALTALSLIWGTVLPFLVK